MEKLKHPVRRELMDLFASVDDEDESQKDGGDSDDDV